MNLSNKINYTDLFDQLDNNFSLLWLSCSTGVLSKFCNNNRVFLISAILGITYKVDKIKKLKKIINNQKYWVTKVSTLNWGIFNVSLLIHLYKSLLIN